MELKNSKGANVFSTKVCISIEATPFRQFSFGRNQLSIRSFTRNKFDSRDVRRERGRAPRHYRPDERLRKSASSALSSFLRFLRMNKPGLHPPAAARHPLPEHKARCLPENSSCVLRHPSFPIFLLFFFFFRRPNSTVHLNGQRRSRCPNSPHLPPLVTSRKWKPSSRAHFSSTVISEDWPGISSSKN